MPGIAGVIGATSPEEGKRLVRTMIGSMRHRPSFVAGTHTCADLGVYAGWVAHPGSFAAEQSAAMGADGTRLLISGERIPTGDDPPAGTELLRRGYKAGAETFIASLNGLFSGLLIDRQRRRAWLFCDRYGSERVYIYEKGKMLLFASEAKALLTVLAEARAFDDVGVGQFLTYGSTFDGRSLFRGVRVLPGGSLWSFGPAGARTEGYYFRPEEWERQPPLDEERFQTRFEETFASILPAYVTSPEAVGISVTGGLDTRMIMACLPPAARRQPVCYTYVGLSGRTLDARLGARVAAACGLQHHDLRVGADFLADFGAQVDRTVFITDGCAGALQAHELYYSRLARALSPVRLTGNYGSEVLRGVSTFKPLRLAPDLFAPAVAGGGAEGASAAEADALHPITRAAFREVPWHLFGVLAAARSELIVRSPYLDNRIVALAYRAPERVRQTADAALRLIAAKSPALAAIPSDRGLVAGRNGAATLPRQLFCNATFKLDYLYAHGLPHRLSRLAPVIASLAGTGLLGLHKFLLYRAWFRRELAPYVTEVLGDPRTRQLPFWNGGVLPSIIADHVKGRRNYTDELHLILTLEAIDRTLIRGSGATDSTAGDIVACAS